MPNAKNDSPVSPIMHCAKYQQMTRNSQVSYHPEVQNSHLRHPLRYEALGKRCAFCPFWMDTYLCHNSFIGIAPIIQRSPIQFPSYFSHAHAGPIFNYLTIVLYRRRPSRDSAQSEFQQDVSPWHPSRKTALTPHTSRHEVGPG